MHLYFAITFPRPLLPKHLVVLPSWCSPSVTPSSDLGAATSPSSQRHGCCGHDKSLGFCGHSASVASVCLAVGSFGTAAKGVCFVNHTTRNKRIKLKTSNIPIALSAVFTLQSARSCSCILQWVSLSSLIHVLFSYFWFLCTSCSICPFRRSSSILASRSQLFDSSFALFHV